MIKLNLELGVLAQVYLRHLAQEWKVCHVEHKILFHGDTNLFSNVITGRWKNSTTKITQLRVLEALPQNLDSMFSNMGAHSYL